MFRWLIRGLVFLFIAYGLSNTDLEPNTGFFIAIAVFAMLHGLPGLLGRARGVRFVSAGTSHQYQRQES